MNRKLKLFSMSALILLLVILSACGDDDKKANSGAKGEGASDDEQVLIYARGGDSTSLDFASTSDGESSRVTRNIFESLVTYDKDSFEVVPALAHDWDISEDGKTYNFYLEEGVTFHDGTDFDADAVKLNFDRWSDPDHEYSFAEEGYVYALYESLFGGYQGDEGHVIDEVNVVDDYEIEFKLKEPLGPFLQNLGSHYFAITSPAALEEYGADIDENPVGTGPFQFVSWSKDDQIVLEKFEDYRKDGLPKLDKVIYEVIPDNAARVIALRSGEVDIIDDVNPDEGANIESEEGLELYSREANNVGFLGFQTEKEPLNDKLVRQAISHAVDTEALVDALYAGYAEKGVGLLPPGYLGYNEDLEGYDYDLDKAQELLAEAGYEDGLDVEFWVMPVSRPYMPDPEKVAEIIQNDLEKIGINADIVREEWAPYIEKTTDGEHEMFLLGWSGANGDPDYFLTSLLHSDSIGGENRSFYTNEEVDKLLDEAKATVDEDERAELYKEAQVLINEDVPAVFMVHSTPLVGARDAVKNFVPHPSTSDPLEEVEIVEE